ncbi:hypothetical protein CGGC5_v003581 [Colletotrichum fructicola Nara gc5]|uniref:Uncharacterized protein n=1 Tax=Colletotrichum fructicola (strain Nara gc5) TaxID=1213859 RepID=A0A7J6JCR2_COLFN|nr:hypothetical protein CGGC5_v003581 [Colletotrichum fructicola Nara gc5]
MLRPLEFLKPQIHLPSRSLLNNKSDPLRTPDLELQQICYLQQFVAVQLCSFLGYEAFEIWMDCTSSTFLSLSNF